MSLAGGGNESLQNHKRHEASCILMQTSDLRQSMQLS